MSRVNLNFPAVNIVRNREDLVLVLGQQRGCPSCPHHREAAKEDAVRPRKGAKPGGLCHGRTAPKRRRRTATDQTTSAVSRSAAAVDELLLLSSHSQLVEHVNFLQSDDMCVCVQQRVQIKHCMTSMDWRIWVERDGCGGGLLRSDRSLSRDIQGYKFAQSGCRCSYVGRFCGTKLQPVGSFTHESCDISFMPQKQHI